jgi:hypothetical protein
MRDIKYAFREIIKLYHICHFVPVKTSVSEPEVNVQFNVFPASVPVKLPPESESVNE